MAQRPVLCDALLSRVTRHGKQLMIGCDNLSGDFQPMLRTALLCLIITVVGLTALSEIGVNVAPLLAGAGIVGIAIGFGSQKLVQDLITGLFLLLENTSDFFGIAELETWFPDFERFAVWPATARLLWALRDLDRPELAGQIQP